MRSPLVAYYRVSTDRQDRSGLGLDAQRKLVRSYADRTKRKLIAEYKEARSGRRPPSERPRLLEAIAAAKSGAAEVVVAKLDRLTRSVRHMLDLVDVADGVRFLFLDHAELDYQSAAGRMMLITLVNFAEFESRRIGERIAAALERNRDRGNKHVGFGASKRTQRRAMLAAKKARRAAAEDYRKLVLASIVALHRKLKTLTRTCDRLNAQGILTFSGKKWTIANLEAFLKDRNRGK